MTLLSTFICSSHYAPFFIILGVRSKLAKAKLGVIILPYSIAAHEQLVLLCCAVGHGARNVGHEV